LCNPAFRPRGRSSSRQLCTYGTEIWIADQAYWLLRRQGSPPESFPDLLENLTDTFQFQSSDTRDLIYAFFGVKSHRYKIFLDYSNSTSYRDVCVRLGRQVIAHTSQLGILRKAIMTLVAKRAKISPTWVPNWRCIISYPFWHEKSRVYIPVRVTVSFPDSDSGVLDYVATVTSNWSRTLNLSFLLEISASRRENCTAREREWLLRWRLQ
jgi:hypothetical protein